MTDTQQRFSLITEEGLESLRRLIGVPIEDSLEPWCYEATRDNIRHYAHGIGDDNPLWCDPVYAAKTRYGRLVAPPAFVFPLNRILSGYVGGLPGVHVRGEHQTAREMGEQLLSLSEYTKFIVKKIATRSALKTPLPCARFRGH